METAVDSDDPNLQDGAAMLSPRRRTAAGWCWCATTARCLRHADHLHALVWGLSLTIIPGIAGPGACCVAAPLQRIRAIQASAEADLLPAT